MRSVVSITLTTLDDTLARKLEPFAPSPQRRLRSIEYLKSKDIKVAVRLDPIIPLINDSPQEIRMLLKTLADMDVDQIISSVYKAKRDNFARISGVFKERAQDLRKIYYEMGEKVRGIRYAPKSLRLKILRVVREEASKRGIPFSVCREGLDMNTAATCDASHLL